MQVSVLPLTVSHTSPRFPTFATRGVRFRLPDFRQCSVNCASNTSGLPRNYGDLAIPLTDAEIDRPRKGRAPRDQIVRIIESATWALMKSIPASQKAAEAWQTNDVSFDLCERMIGKYRSVVRSFSRTSRLPSDGYR